MIFRPELKARLAAFIMTVFPLITSLAQSGTSTVSALNDQAEAYLAYFQLETQLEPNAENVRKVLRSKSGSYDPTAEMAAIRIAPLYIADTHEQATLIRECSLKDGQSTLVMLSAAEALKEIDKDFAKKLYLTIKMKGETSARQLEAVSCLIDFNEMPDLKVMEKNLARPGSGTTNLVHEIVKKCVSGNHTESLVGIASILEKNPSLFQKSLELIRSHLGDRKPSDSEKNP